MYVYRSVQAVQRKKIMAVLVLLIVVLLPCACGGEENDDDDDQEPADDDATPDDDTDNDTGNDDDDDTPDPFEHTIYTYTFDETVNGIATGDYFEPSHLYPDIAVDAKYTYVLNFEMNAFAPPWRESFWSNGPLVLYSDEMDVIVFSPMEHFYTSLTKYEDGKIRHGIEGEIDSIPAGFRHRFILVEGKGIAATLERWGQFLLDDRGIDKRDRYRDTGVAKIGYWTDNGSAYFYNTIDDLNYEDTLLAIKQEADELDIPYGYFQIDSWWYYRGPDTLFKYGGLVRWEPRPDVFPDGLTAFHERLGLPLIAHNKWFVIDNDYRDDHPFVHGKKWAMPLGRDVFDQFMADAERWGIETYEPDWLMDHMWEIPYLRKGLYRADDWMQAQSDAATDSGRTMQLCMPGAAHIMATIDLPAVTTVRTSIDYHRSISKESYWPMFHAVNMIAWAVGVWPFKDNFHSAERCGMQEAMISNLSGGMVGVGDFIGRAKPDILLRTCRDDGLLLKPDKPAVPIDAMFFEHQRPYIVNTYSDRGELGRWTYLGAFHIARDHPDRTIADEIFVLVTYFRDLNRMFVWPREVTDWHLDLPGDLGINENVVAYNWRTGEAREVEGEFDLPVAPGCYDYTYLVLAPIFDNGLALIGESEKFVTLADRRFTGIEMSEDGVLVTLAGVPGETVTVKAYDTAADAMLSETAVIGNDGETTIELHR